MVGLRSHPFLIVALSGLAALLAGCGAGGASHSQTPLATYTVTVTAPAAGTGIVTSSPPGINCPPTCTAAFPQNSQIKLNAIPSGSYVFGGWGGGCSGASTCNLKVDSAESVSAVFSAGAAKQVVAYVFTADALELKSLEFALLADGELKPTTHSIQPLLMTGTTHGLVVNTPAANGAPTSNLQSYAVQGDGSLRAQGTPVSIAMNQSVSLASDQSYVYAATDEGLFGFVDATSGLSPLSPIQQTVPPPQPCTVAQENANQCRNASLLQLSSGNAFLMQYWTSPSTSALYQLSSFTRAQGQLTAEQLFAGTELSTGIFASTPDGKFVYAMDLASSRVFRYAMGGNGSYETNILSNGQPLSDGFVQLIISDDVSTNNGWWLFAPVSDAVESPRIRVFHIDPASGDLTEIAGSPFLTGEYYLVGATLDPSSHFLLAIHSYCDGSPPCMGPGKLVAMSVNSSTGALSVTSDVEDGQNPFAVTAVSISH